MSDATPAAPPWPWGRALAWLAFLGPLFFLSYGAANALAEARGVTRSVIFPWEAAIPFLPWTIVPYWSIDLLYGLSFLACRSQREVDTHGLRLLGAQVISVACFLVFPLRNSSERPAIGAPWSPLFDALAAFDKPYNQAPALHISLLLIIWARFAPRLRGPARGLAGAWALLIALSTLTTWQHHFIDLPSGATAGLLCLWLFPDRGLRPRWQPVSDPHRRRLAGRYALGALICTGLALSGAWGGWTLWLLWPAISLAAVALAYRGLGARVFREDDGQRSAAAAWLLAPYTLAARLNARLWTRGVPRAVAITDGVWLGRHPIGSGLDSGGYAALLDLAPELPPPSGPARRISLPWLDLVPPQPADLAAAAAAIEALRPHGPVLVYCALGYSRSAAAVAAWLLLSGRANDMGDALARVQAARPQAVQGPEHRRALATLASPTGLGQTLPTPTPPPSAQE
ncbi:MAG: phosphatase PAP2/dual specificity phosphatase family protein [Azonexus sp.]|nr:phosphatase PAP2/dual specificity phosphatase family protein [Betaproteobacteria bacterium]MBK8916538.1 phosphatase PAP2/dual specificity phosphatase family protein [Betaproteobacteria bacterium]MBP6035730.1 phosphatase PAP2/dual specificity phosphatase family protein [Azonexus sp.]MBP6906890.1 phosphatase PAP2/dual specificity phosphatase family protein [Azonexus sp.]